MAKGFRSNFTFGALMAESDPLLPTAYWDNGDFEAIQSPHDHRCFIIGRTGSGKSAALQHLEETFPDKVVRIAPENLSLPYITNLGVARQLLHLGVHLEVFLKALWKHVIIVEILRHRYDVTTPEQKLNMLQAFRERFKRDPAKIKALEYLDEFGDKFWCEADERVKQIAETFERKISASGGIEILSGVPGLGVKASGDVEQRKSQEVQWEALAKYQRIVNEAQLPRLNEMIDTLDQWSLDSQHFTYLVIDDLDKEWEDEELANLLIRCLFFAVVDLQRIKHLKILVALRTNIFQHLNFGAQSRGGQEEKFRNLALHLRWTAQDLRSLLDSRAESACRLYHIEPVKTLTQMLPKANKAGDPVAHILERTLMRPRDAILYLNACAREAAGKDGITWQEVYGAERAYSRERLLALRDEWKDPFLDIDKILDKFRESPRRLNRQQLTDVLDEIALLAFDDTFRGTTWLTALCHNIWEGGQGYDWYHFYGELAKLLYTISFLGIAKGRDTRAVYSYEDSDRIQRAADVPEATYFEIHPAFRQALDIDYVTLS